MEIAVPASCGLPSAACFLILAVFTPTLSPPPPAGTYWYLMESSTYGE